ncbi:MAG: hypothetical protein KDB01_05230, partial [Planctomycetaceae bacterium]|nr:hypothetical protein [Planctomycetaceae bacterium]
HFKADIALESALNPAAIRFSPSVNPQKTVQNLRGSRRFSQGGVSRSSQSHRTVQVSPSLRLDLVPDAARCILKLRS